MAIKHGNLTGSEVHVPYSFTATAATLSTLLNSVLDTDIGKLCLQTDENKLYMLIKPAGFEWKEVGTGSGDTATTASDIACPVINGVTYNPEGTVQTALDYLDQNKTSQGHTHTIGSIQNLQTSLDAKIAITTKNQANGVAGLDSEGKLATSVLPTIGSGAVATVDENGQISESQLPATVPLLSNGKLDGSVLPGLALVDVHVVADLSARDALTGIEQGDIAMVTSEAKTYVHDGSAWVEILAPAGGITSFNGRTGPAVVPATGDYSADQVDCSIINGITYNPAGTVQTALDYLDQNKTSQGHTHSIASIVGLQNALDSKVATSAINTANGVAGLGADGKLNAAVIPVGTGTEAGNVVVLDGDGLIPVEQIPEIPSSQIIHGSDTLSIVITNLQSELAGKAGVNDSKIWSQLTVVNANETHWGAGTAPATVEEAINRLASLLSTHMGITIP